MNISRVDAIVVIIWAGIVTILAILNFIRQHWLFENQEKIRERLDALEEEPLEVEAIEVHKTAKFEDLPECSPSDEVDESEETKVAC